MTSKQTIKPDTQDGAVEAPLADACDTCGSPLDLHDPYCPACGAAQQAAGVQRPEEARGHFHCEQCGADIGAALQGMSVVCPFCESNYVVEVDPALTGKQAPEFVVPFEVAREQAEQAYREWMKNRGWMQPGDMHTARVEERLRGVYLPFWSFSMLATSRWRARIGEYWYKTTGTGKNRKRKRMTEWWSLQGNHHRYYSGHLVSGSRGLPQDWALRLMPYRLEALQRFAPRYLAGWYSETYSVDPDVALPECQHVFFEMERRAVAAFLPGDTHRDLHVETSFSRINSDLVLAPVYLLTYRYRDKLYRFMVNGQSGRVTGEKPTSQLRVTIVSVLVAALLAALVGAIMFLSGAH